MAIGRESVPKGLPPEESCWALGQLLTFTIFAVQLCTGNSLLSRELLSEQLELTAFIILHHIDLFGSFRLFLMPNIWLYSLDLLEPARQDSETKIIGEHRPVCPFTISFFLELQKSCKRPCALMPEINCVLSTFSCSVCGDLFAQWPL